MIYIYTEYNKVVEDFIFALFVFCFKNFIRSVIAMKESIQSSKQVLLFFYSGGVTIFFDNVHSVRRFPRY